MIFLIILIPIGAAIYFLVRREQKRQAAIRLKEAEFLEGARANAGSAPIVRSAADMAIRDATPAQPAQGQSPYPASAAAFSDVVPVVARAAFTPTSSKDTRCMLCAEKVDVLSNDQRNWGVKIPDEASGALRWYHFTCVTRELARGALLDASLKQVLHAHASGSAEEFQNALANAARMSSARVSSS